MHACCGDASSHPGWLQLSLVQYISWSLSGPATLQVLQAETDATARRDLARALARFVLSLLSHLTMCWPLPQRQQQYLNAPVQPGSANPSALSSQQAAQQLQADGSDSCSAAVASLLCSLAACDVSTWQQLQQLASGAAGDGAGPAQGADGSGDDSEGDSDSGEDDPAVVAGACLAAVYSITAVTAPATAGAAAGPLAPLLAPPGQAAELLSLCCQLGRPLVDLSAGLQSQALLHKALAFVAAGGKLAQQRQRAAGAEAALGTGWQGGAGEVLESEVWPTLQVGA